jgi:GH25 family lysozyme M1 (1,4-beta-N-acetylmuramidase)
MSVLYGIDVSLYQGNINWTKVNTDFAMIRIATGKTYPDSYFEKNYANAKAAGIPIGAYYYMYATTEAAALAEAKKAYELIKDKTFEYPFYLDIETDAQANLSQGKLESIIQTFLRYFEDRKWFVGIYSFESLLSKLSDSFRKRYTIWCANISRKPDISCDIWQYSWKGKNAGVGNGKADVDTNYCYKDFPSIIRKAGLNNTQITEKVNTPAQEPINTSYEDYIPSSVVFYTPKEKNVITTFKNVTKMNAAGNKRLSNHFQVKEFLSPDCGEVKIHSKLIRILEALYAALDCSSIIVTSGYRTSTHDLAVGGDGKGQHTLGRAADIVCYDKNKKVIPAAIVCCTLEQMGNVYGIGYISATATHVDTREASKKWWGDETKSGCPNISKLGYSSFFDYFKINEKEGS